MTARSVLHPDDHAAQGRLNDQIIALRKAHFADAPVGTYAHLLGLKSSALWTVEHPNRVSRPIPRFNMSLGSIERRCAPMEHTLVANLVDLPDVEDDPVVALLAARRPEDPMRRAANLAALTVARLDAARLDLGLSTRAVAARLGVSNSCLAELLAIAGAGTRLSTLQRYARALGGRLTLSLVPLES